MADLPDTARVVVIGGGAVGASCLYHLALKGWADVVLIEKNELTSGSTWHAAGNIPTFSSSWAIMNMQRYSTELYRDLGERVDYPMNYHVTGSIRLAHSHERMMEFERAKSMGRYQGIPMEMLDIEETKARYPFIETHDLEGALYDPTDGDIDPAQLTQALAKGSRDLGAKIVRFTTVTGIARDGTEWRIETDKGTIRAEYFVNAAGYRAQEIGAMVGRKVPMATMSHQYMLTEPVPELEAWSKENGRKLPLLRDVDSSYYLRQEKTGFNLGPYERHGRAHWTTDDDRMPDDFSFQLWEDDLERIEWYIEDAMARVPLLGSSGVSRVINGPIPYAPDGLPLIGPMPGVPNAFEACVFTFGIAQAGGAGKTLAEWIIEGGTEWDMWAVDPRRFGDWCDHQYCVDKAVEVYGHEYAMHFPHHACPAARDRRLSPNHEKLKSLGAQFGAFNGWERALWFARPGDNTSEEATQTWARSGPWEPRVREECEAVRDACGVIDICGFSRFRLSGVGAAAWLRTRITGRLPRVGRMSLVYFADDRGRIVTEMSVARPADDRLYLVTAAAAQSHDYDLLAAALPQDGSLTLEDITEDYNTLLVTGPKAREVLGKLCNADLSLPWLSQQYSEIEGAWVALTRVSFAGELGWEITHGMGDGAKIYDAVLAAGATPFGMFALDSLRIEKGYRTWKSDLSADYSVLELGLDRFVKLDKAAFPGREALLNERQQGSQKRFAPLKVAANGCDAPSMSLVWQGDEIVGEVTSGAYGYRVGASIALAMLRPDLTAPGTAVEVEIFGKRHPAEVQADAPLWDPSNERIRA